MLTTGEAARLLGISERTVISWSNRGLLRPVRTIAGWRKFNESDVRRLKKLAASRRPF